MKRHLHVGHLLVIIYSLISIWFATQGLYLLGSWIESYFPSGFLVDSYGNEAPAWIIGLLSLLSIATVVIGAVGSVHLIELFCHRLVDAYDWLCPKSQGK